MKAAMIISHVILALAMVSCTVKEDRGPCPCILDIYLEDSGEYADKVVVSGWNEQSSRLFLDRIDPAMYPLSYPKKVDKGTLHLCAYGGNGSMTLKGDKLIIPEGSQCDPVWAFRSAPIDASDETAEAHVTMHKQYAVIHIRVDLPDNMDQDVTLKAVGTSNGFDISTLSPSRGPFHCLALPDGDSFHEVMVPRQHDDSLVLEVYLDGSLSRQVEVGSMIADTGYSWGREDLEDIYLTLSLFTPGEAGISVSGWDTDVSIFTY